MLLASPDKFKGTARAAEVAQAIVEGAALTGHQARALPLADGGEGTLDAFGGANQHRVVRGPLGNAVDAKWRLEDDFAVIEMAEASGLVLAGGREHNDPLAASTEGTGELIAAAIAAGARRIVVGVGGSATTDGGLGAVEVLGRRPFSDLGVTVEVACDVETTFLDAARVFAPQKGADPDVVAELALRLAHLQAEYRASFGVELAELSGGGAAGGLAGGLHALGANLSSGFTVVADHVGLEAAIAQSELVITGEGRLDATSFAGKVVGGVAKLARRHDVPLLVIAGEIADDADERIEAISLTSRYGAVAARRETLASISDAVATRLGTWHART